MWSFSISLEANFQCIIWASFQPDLDPWHLGSQNSPTLTLLLGPTQNVQEGREGSQHAVSPECSGGQERLGNKDKLTQGLEFSENFPHSPAELLPKGVEVLG